MLVTEKVVAVEGLFLEALERINRKQRSRAMAEWLRDELKLANGHLTIECPQALITLVNRRIPADQLDLGLAYVLGQAATQSFPLRPPHTFCLWLLRCLSIRYPALGSAIRDGAVQVRIEERPANAVRITFRWDPATCPVERMLV